MKHVITFSLFALIQVHSSTTFQEKWASLRHDSRNSGYANVTVNSTRGSLDRGFCARSLFTESSTSPSIPFVVASSKYPGVIYGGDSLNRVWTIEESNGSWKTRSVSLGTLFPGLPEATSSGIVSAPTAAVNDAGDEVLVIASADGHVYCINMEGSPSAVWYYSSQMVPPQPFLSPPRYVNHPWKGGGPYGDYSYVLVSESDPNLYTGGIVSSARSNPHSHPVHYYFFRLS